MQFEDLGKSSCIEACTYLKINALNRFSILLDKKIT
jgi:hypothetical protein